MKISVSLLVLLFVKSLAFSQDEKRIVFWGGDENCAYKSKAFTQNDVVRCSSIPTNRGNVSVITHNGTGLTIAFLEEGEYIIAAVRISNFTKDPILFDADSWGAAHFKTKADFYSGEKPILAETTIPTRDIIRGMASDARLDNSLDTFIASAQKTTEIKEVRRNDGTRVRTAVVVPDKAAQEEAQRRGEIRSNNIANEQQKIRSTALTSKTVPADGFVKGLVYFRRVKKARFVLFSIGISDTTYAFQMNHSAK